MYELSVAQELYCKSRKRADDVRGRALESVRVAVGELSGVNPALLRSAWKLATSESIDDQCQLEIEVVAARQICPQCGAEAWAKSLVHPTYCGHCKCHLRVEHGAEIEVLEIRFEPELAMA